MAPLTRRRLIKAAAAGLLSPLAARGLVLPLAARGLLSPRAARAGGGIAVPPLPASGFPTPPFQASGLKCWLNAKNAAYAYEDPFVAATFSALEDISGAGNGFNQWMKPFQPSVGPVDSGLFFNAGDYFPCIALDMLTGASQFTFGMVFTLSSSFSGGTAYRTLLGANAAGQNQQFWLYARSGKATLYVRPGGTGSAYSTSAGATLSNDAKHTLIGVVDMVAGTAALSVDGSSYGTVSWTPGATQAVVPPSALYLGNNYTTPGTDEPLVGEIVAFTCHDVALSSGAQSTLQTWLAGL